MYLSIKQIEKTKEHILANARPIDKQLYLFEFEQRGELNVFKELFEYQNLDGGFGNALEPDIRMPGSSPIVTTIAFQYLNEIKRNLPTKMIESGMNYFVKTMQRFNESYPMTYYWPTTFLDVNSYPHAPWWDIEKIKPPSLENWPSPSIEIIGYMIQHKNFIHKELLIELLNDLENYLEMNSILTGQTFYKFLNFKRILPNVSKNVQDKIFQLLDNTFRNDGSIGLDRLREIKIQMLVTEKSSYFYTRFPQAVENLLQHEVKLLTLDGGSHPSWKWGGKNLWAQVEKEWSGKLTYDLLVTLKYLKLADFDKE